MSQTPLAFGLLGFPVKHSFSPAMHNAAFKELGINAEYKLFEIKPEKLQNFLLSLEEKGIKGLNVTIPYKEKVLNSDFIEIDEESFYARKIGAVNTIIVKNGKLKAFNTDMPGFSRHLKENISPVGKKVAVLGAGGAAKAVVYCLAENKVKEIAIYDIDKIKSQNIVSLIKSSFNDFPISAVNGIEALRIQEKELLINTTPIGMKPSDPCLITEKMLHRNLFIYDLIYNPQETKLLALANKAQVKNSNGLGMLLYQGVLSFTHFTGKKAPVETMRQALKKELEKCRK